MALRAVATLQRRRRRVATGTAWWWPACCLLAPGAGKEPPPRPLCDREGSPDSAGATRLAAPLAARNGCAALLQLALLPPLPVKALAPHTLPSLPSKLASVQGSAQRGCGAHGTVTPHTARSAGFESSGLAALIAATCGAAFPGARTWQKLPVCAPAMRASFMPGGMEKE